MPDLAPADFFFFPFLKDHLCDGDYDVIKSAEDFLSGPDELIYKTGIQKLQKCGISALKFVKIIHTHTIVLLLFLNLSGTTRVSRYQKCKTRKGKTNLDLLEQEIVSGSGIC